MEYGWDNSPPDPDFELAKIPPCHWQFRYLPARRAAKERCNGVVNHRCSQRYINQSTPLVFFNHDQSNYTGRIAIDSDWKFFKNMPFPADVYTGYVWQLSTHPNPNGWWFIYPASSTFCWATLVKTAILCNLLGPVCQWTVSAISKIFRATSQVCPIVCTICRTISKNLKVISKTYELSTINHSGLLMKYYFSKIY